MKRMIFIGILVFSVYGASEAHAAKGFLAKNLAECIEEEKTLEQQLLQRKKLLRNVNDDLDKENEEEKERIELRKKAEKIIKDFS